GRGHDHGHHHPRSAHRGLCRPRDHRARRPGFHGHGTGGMRMNPDFVRLALAGSRNALGRLAAIAGGIALGMAMILLLVGAYIGLGARDARGAWVNIVGTPVAEDAVPAEDAVLVARVEDWFMGQRIGRFDIAAPAGVALDMPGMPAP